MVNIQNKQRKFDIKSYKIEQKLNFLLDVLGYKKYDIGLLITTNKTIASYNQTYRQKDKPTDILSFPYHPHLKAGEKIIVEQTEDKNLGDMIISLEYVEKDAKNLGVTLLDRIDVLLGYDHIIDADYLVMKKEEERLLELLREKFYK